METFLDDLEEIYVQVSQEAAVLVDSQSDLMDTFVSIESNGTVDREQGTVILKNAPSLESAMPTLFTQFPTKTNINVAIEGFWEGVGNAITKVFELIFKLVGGVLKLFVKPFEWLFGAKKSEGAVAKAEKSVEKLSSKETIEAVDEAGPKVVEEAIAKTVKDNRFNEWEYRVISNPRPELYNDINDFIIAMYETILNSTKEFMTAYSKVEGGDKFYFAHHNLSTITSSASIAIKDDGGKFLNEQFKQLGLSKGDVSSISKVHTLFVSLENKIREFEALDTDLRLVRKFCGNKFSNLKTTAAELEAGLNFEKSDVELFKLTDTYSSKFESLENQIRKLVSRDLQELGLTADDVAKVKEAVNLQLQTMRTASYFIRILLMVSIKGKRAMFKGIAEFDKIFAALQAIDKANK